MVNPAIGKTEFFLRTLMLSPAIRNPKRKDHHLAIETTEEMADTAEMMTNMAEMMTEDQNTEIERIKMRIEPKVKRKREQESDTEVKEMMISPVRKREMIEEANRKNENGK